MPRFVVPTNANIHAVKSFLSQQEWFGGGATAALELHPRWIHVEPLALSMLAAWGAWCRRHGHHVVVENLGKHADYAARMRLFQHIGVDYAPPIHEHEEAGRFLPITQVSNAGDLQAVIGNISAMLHLAQDPESLAAVQYCVSELLRNVLEHSGSPDGAFVSAHRFSERPPHRVTIAVADCGRGVTSHLASNYAVSDDMAALGLAMQPGITGATRGPYGGTPENAGAGLFITRCIAKGTGGYFCLVSGSAAYRLRRSLGDHEMIQLFPDPFDDPRHDRWTLPCPWIGTAATVEIRTEMIADYSGFFQWIFRQIPSRASVTRRIRFT